MQLSEKGISHMLTYGLTREFPFDFDTVMAELPKVLRKKGFEILSTCHIDQTFNELMDIDFRRYSILSVTILPLAYKALVREKDFGVALPCNIAVYEKNGETVISTIRPSVFMHVIGNENLTTGASVMERKLQDVLDAFERKKIKTERSRIQKGTAYEKAVA